MNKLPVDHNAITNFERKYQLASIDLYSVECDLGQHRLEDRKTILFGND